jgi:amino acid efflux transporter
VISPRADDRPAAGRLGLLGLYRAGAALPRLWRGDGGGGVATEYRGPSVRREALWVACVIGYLACFASLNIYIQSFARLVWSQAQHKPKATSHGCRHGRSRAMPSTPCWAAAWSARWHLLLDINLDALIVYANGIFIMIYLLCMLAGCRLLRGRYRLLAVVGSILCLLLLAMVGWKSLYALVMLAGLWLFLPRRKLATGSV